jgi:hypothetical protein
MTSAILRWMISRLQWFLACAVVLVAAIATPIVPLACASDSFTPVDPVRREIDEAVARVKPLWSASKSSPRSITRAAK